jgi:hypothetical protein
MHGGGVLFEGDRNAVNPRDGREGLLNAVLVGGAGHAGDVEHHLAGAGSGRGRRGSRLGPKIAAGGDDEEGQPEGCASGDPVFHRVIFYD